jgi:hypothetical protein
VNSPAKLCCIVSQRWPQCDLDLATGRVLCQQAESLTEPSVATLRWCSGSSRNAVRISSGMCVQLPRNPQLVLDIAPRQLPDGMEHLQPLLTIPVFASPYGHYMNYLSGVGFAYVCASLSFVKTKKDACAGVIGRCRRSAKVLFSAQESRTVRLSCR